MDDSRIHPYDMDHTFGLPVIASQDWVADRLLRIPKER